MKKHLPIFLLILISSSIQKLNAQEVTIENARKQFFSMNNSDNGALTLYKSLQNVDLSKKPVLLAYRGASSAASAAIANGVRKKLEYFNHGKEELEKAVALKPLDAEIRFLRLATQVNAPGFLGYTSDISNDKSLIINTLSAVPANHANAYLYQQICSFMLIHVEMKPSEKSTINQLLQKFKHD